MRKLLGRQLNQEDIRDVTRWSFLANERYEILKLDTRYDLPWVWFLTDVNLPSLRVHLVVVFDGADVDPTWVYVDSMELHRHFGQNIICHFFEERVGRDLPKEDTLVSIQ